MGLRACKNRDNIPPNRTLLLSHYFEIASCAVSLLNNIWASFWADYFSQKFKNYIENPVVLTRPEDL